MSNTGGLGQVRTLSDSEQELPASKRPRIEPIVEVSEVENLKAHSSTKPAVVVVSEPATRPAAKKDGKKSSVL